MKFLPPPFLIYLTLSVMSSLLSMQVHAAWEEQIVNGSFESGSSGWDLKHMSLQGSDVYDGTQAVQLVPGTFYKYGFQEFALEPGDELQATAMMKLDSIAGSFGLGIRFYDDTGTQIGSISLGGGDGTVAWTLISTSGTAPAGTAYARIQAGTLGVSGGIAFLDAVSVVKNTATEIELMTNGGFESEYSGWNKKHASLSTTEVYEGTNASSIAGGSFFKFSYQDVVVSDTMTLRARCYIKADSMSGTGGIDARFYNASGSQIGSQWVGGVTGTTGWTAMDTGEFTLPVGTTKVRIQCQVGSNVTGTTYYDSFSLVEIVPDTGMPPINFTDQQLTDVTVNGDLETGSFSGGDWVKGKLSIETSNVYNGSYAGKLEGASFYKLGSYRKAVLPGEVYTFSCAAACDNLSFGSSINIRYLDASESELGSASVASFIGTRAWREYRTENIRIPAGGAYVDIRIGSSSGNVGGTTWFDDFKLEQNTGLPVKAVATYESAGLTVLVESTTADCVIYYREVGEQSWHETVTPMYDGNTAGEPEFRGSVVNLQPDTDYQAYVFILEGETVVDEGGVSFNTWQSSPNIGQYLTVAELYTGGRLDLTGISGTPDSWVKITGTGTNDIDAGYALDEAIYLLNNQYLILENIQVAGGRRYGIHLERCHEVRVLNCDVSGWARTPGYVSSGISYEDYAAYQAGTAINMDGGIFLDESSRLSVERCYLHDPRLSANSWAYGHPNGPEGIVVNANSLSGNHVVRYNDIIGSDVVRWNDGIEGYNNSSVNGSFARDSDIYGNMICYGQDDVIELDGGQENVRFFGNKGQDFLCGISVAPNRKGPSYLFRNAIVDLGDSRDIKGCAVKQGGGSDYTRGFTYMFNNTFHTWGYGGIAGVGFGSQNENNERKRFFAVTRNNIVYCRSSSADAISDFLQLTTNSFDFDNLTTGTDPVASVIYSAGQEANGLLSSPPAFVDMTSPDYYDDLRLAVGSSAIDTGEVLPNFAEIFAGSAPDQGALEYGDSSLLPIRPIAVEAGRYRVYLDATAGGSSTSETITLSTGSLGGSTAFSIEKNATTGWLNVSPSSGTLNNNSTQDLSFTVNTSAVVNGTTRKAVVLVRLPDGMSLPLTIEASIN